MQRTGLGLVVILAGFAAALAFRARVADGGTPPWDSASHGLQGYAIAQDVARLDAPNFIADVFGHRYRYAPGHPLVLAAAYLVFGASWWTAIAVSALLFAGLAVALYATAETPLAGWICALLALACPALLGLSGEIMLEIPGAILLVIAFRLYSRSLTDDTAVRPLGWTLFALMLTAAQYAACAIAILAVYELWRGRAWFREVIVRFVKSRALFHPVHILIAVAILAAVAIRFTGGGSIPIGGRSLSMTRAGGPLIAAALLVGLRVAWLVRQHYATLSITVPRRYIDIFITGVVPIYAWVFVLYPPRFQQFAEWVARPPAGHARTDPAHWTYYPSWFVEGGHVAVSVAAGVAALVVASFIRRDASERSRFLRWAALSGMALVLLHPARQTRFIVPFLPAWWVLASETLVGFFPVARSRIIATVAASAAIVLPAIGLYTKDLAATVAPPPVNREFAKALNWTVEQLATSPSTRVIGGVEGLSRHLFEWELRKVADLRKQPLEFNLDLPENFETDPAGPRKVYDRWISGRPEATVAVLEPIDLVARPPRPISKVRKADHDWPEFTMRFLRVEPGYKLDADRAFVAAGLRVRIYRRSALDDASR